MSTVNELQLMTKKRLQNLRRRSLGLQQLAVQIILKQLTFYRTHPDELEKLKNSPSILREKFLQVLMKKECSDLDEQGEKMEFENLKEIFPLLLSPRTRYIELNGILSFCPDRYKVEKVTQWCVQLLKQLETRAPQVETLVIQRNNPFYRCSLTHIQYNHFYQEMVQSFMKLQKLNRLQVDFYAIQFNDLLKISKKLSTLQYINVGCVYYSGEYEPAPEDVSSSFRNLKELIFECPEENNWLGCLCTQNLPNIEVVQYDPNKIMNWTYLRSFDNRYQGLNFHGASNLRHICVDLEKYSTEEVEAMPTLFPKVICLMVQNTHRLGKNVMPKFDNIRQLQLMNPHGSGVFEYLITYGPKLQSIYLGHDHELITIDLELIFKHCPKLEKLSMISTLFKTPPSKIEFFAELKELELVIPCYNRSDGTHDAEHMLLSTLLSAPKLEKVKLESWAYNENDLWKLNSLIQENRILKNLHTLHVYFTCLIPEAWLNVMKSACAFLPKLTDFQYGHMFSLGQNKDPLLARQRKPTVCNIDASVFPLIDVFENEN